MNYRVLTVVVFLLAVAFYQNCAPVGKGGAFSLSTTCLSNCPTPTPNSSATPTPTPNATPSQYSTVVTNDGPQNYYRLGEAAGSKYLVDSKSGNTGVVVGAGFNLGLNGAINNDTNTAASLSNGLFVAQSPSAPFTYTEELWINTSTTSGGGIIGFSDTSYSFSDRMIQMLNSGQIQIYLWNLSGSYGVYCISPGAYNDGRWHHVAASISAGLLSYLYIDGTAVCTLTAPSTMRSYSGQWDVGYMNETNHQNQSTSYFFNGSIDEVAIYYKALSQTQIQAHINAAK